MRATTSRMRVSLCMQIVQEVRDRKLDWKLWLAQELDALPFERMGDTALIAMAREVLPGDVVSATLERESAVRYEIPERLALCRVCRDLRHVERDDGWFERCQNCNPYPENTERKAGHR